jgi:hypothetical protein
VSESEVLLTIAEVAVAFAGFASLVGVLGQRSSADAPRVIGVRMRAMLLASLMVVGFSIIPILLDAYGASPDLTWLASSLVLLAVTAGYYWWFVKALQSLSGIPTTRFQSVVVMPTLVTVMFSLFGVLLANVFFASPAVYLTALALLLFQSGFAFSLIVFSFLRQVDATGDEPGREGP